MVVKIQPAHENIMNAVVYNENKMTGEDAVLTPQQEQEYLLSNNTGHVLATVNVPDVSTLENEFEKLKRLNMKKTTGRKMTNPTFHMSVNPGEQDRPMTEAKIVEYVNELMDSLGYSDVPYRIFRHDDIERTHYHVVGIRIGQDGKKIPDSFENRRCEKLCRDLSEKYGYIYGLQDAPEKIEASVKDTRQKERKGPENGTSVPEKPAPVPAEKTPEKSPEKAKAVIKPFDPESNVPLSEQMGTFHEAAMKWSFSTPEQYGMLMKYRYNVLAEMQNEELQFTGLGKKGNNATTPLTEKELGIEALNDILAKCEKTKMSQKKSQKKRLEELARWAAEKSETWDDFRKLMNRKGVITVLSWSKENEPFGVTWLDQATKCAWKGSETDITLQWLKETAERKGWKLTRHPKYEKPAESVRTKSKGGYSLASFSDRGLLEQLMDRRGVPHHRRDETDASKSKSDIRFGDEENPVDIVI